MEADVEVLVDGVTLPGTLTLPRPGCPVVLFAHGSGSSRLSPRNRYVARVLNQAGLGTLLFDLLTRAEGADRGNVFDVDLLAGRLLGATRWLRRSLLEADGASATQAAAGSPTPPPTLTVGYFGASTGAAAALWAAAEGARNPTASGGPVAAVVSRGGRPDLAGPRLADVTCPTLLIVGGYDSAVLELNRMAQAQLSCESDLRVVPGATHLFEEPGTLEQAAEAAREWFTGHMSGL